MNHSIRIATIWSDSDALQLRFEVSDGPSTFVSSAYATIGWFAKSAEALEQFGKQIHGGLFDLEAGGRGPEFADGAFSARFHWHRPNELFVSTLQESDFFEFKGLQVARCARMYVRTEPALLDRFVDELRIASTSEDPAATLECIPLRGAL